MEDKRKDPIEEQSSSDDLTGVKKQVEREQDKNLVRGKDHEIVEHESPEIHHESDKDPRVN